MLAKHALSQLSYSPNGTDHSVHEGAGEPRPLRRRGRGPCFTTRMQIAPLATRPVPREVSLAAVPEVDAAVAASADAGARLGVALAPASPDAVRAAIGHALAPPPGPAEQAAELQLMHTVAAARTASNTASTKTLSVAGERRLWLETLDALHAASPVADAARGRALLDEALALADAVTSRAKRAHARQRPFAADPTLTAVVRRPPGATSYPSNHTAHAFAAATVLTTLWPARAQELRAAALEVARSRVYGGVHFPSDVAAGAFVGAAAGASVSAAAGLGPTRQG